MPNWWNGVPRERYWCEVTDRRDTGADLKAPQKNEAGQDYWSYWLIRCVVPGDIVFHYSTRLRAFAGASVAGAPMEERPIVWAPHGTVGRAIHARREVRLVATTDRAKGESNERKCAASSVHGSRGLHL